MTTMTRAITELTCLPRYSTPRTNRPTYGPKVAKVAENLGVEFMPWQNHVVNVALEVDPISGFLVYRECALTVPRQSGKTVLLLAVMVHRAHAFITAHERTQRILYAAQTRNDARAKWEDEHIKTLEASRYNREFRARLGLGKEAIIWNNGSMHGITANTERSGHGATLDLGVIDEAFAHEDSRLEQAYEPAMSTRDQPQIWINSTAGTAKSTFLRGKVKAGRENVVNGVTVGSCYFEWSAPNEADPGNPDTWWSCMPALGRTIRESTIRHVYNKAIQEGKLGDFRRAYLNQWGDEFPDEWLVISHELWMRQLDKNSKPTGRLVFSIDTTPERSVTSLSVCGKRADGTYHVETIANRSGTSWVVEAMKKLRDYWEALAGWEVIVVIDKASAAASMIPELEDASITVMATQSHEFVAACGYFYDQLKEGTVFHLGQKSLTIAVAGAFKRDLEAAWAWARKNLTLDISPLVGATLALWGYHVTYEDEYDVLDSVR